jgi:hypothetical protein
MKRVLIFLIALSSVGFAVAKSEGIIDFSNRRESFNAGAEPSSALRDGVSGAGYEIETSATTCPSVNEIPNALRKFSSDRESEIDEARALLLNKSRESRSCRREVITALMKAMDKPNLEITTDKDSYNLWLYGARLLGDLKAEEALDLLISHLGLINRTHFSTSMNHQPALGGVIRMGPIAIPKLDAVLRHNHDPGLRYDAVYCIATIGGPSAVSSLREALDSESDECVRQSIRVSLDSFDDDGNIKNRMKWFTAGFLCTVRS